MTQAFNLSQLANNLTSAGLLDAADGLVNAVPIANGGTGASSASAARTNLGVAAAAYSVPAGGIIMWSGSVAAIPSGWFLCNGANGTPDLRDRFVLGAGGAYAVNAVGGTTDAIVVSHTHTASTGAAGAHTHTLNYAAWSEVNEGFGLTVNNYAGRNSGMSTAPDHTHTVTVNSAGSSGANANMPPYFALCFIMKS